MTTRKRSEDLSPPSPTSAVDRPPSSKRQCTGISLSTTKNEPAHYLLKVESFSILTENPSIKIESDVFEASGHKWKLELQLCGNEEEEEEKGGNDISLYLIICDTLSLRSGWNVRVDVKFFVYDHLAYNYVTFQGIDGNRTRFHEKQIKWGFNKLMSLDQFKDKNKGYLFNDSFVFGAEVFVVPEYTLKDRCFSLTKPPATTNTFSWIIDKFSATTITRLNSEVFKIGKIKWILTLFSEAHGTEESKNLSCYLRVDEALLFPEGWRIYAKFQIRVKNQSGYEDKVKETDQWFCKSAIKCGTQCLMPMNEVRDTTKGFLVNDRIIVEATISVIGIQKNFV